MQQRDDARAFLVQDRDGIAAGLAVVVAVDQAADGSVNPAGARPDTRSWTGVVKANGFFGVSAMDCSTMRCRPPT